MKKGFWTCLTTEIGLWTWLKKSQRPISGNVFVVVGETCCKYIIFIREIPPANKGITSCHDDDDDDDDDDDENVDHEHVDLDDVSPHVSLLVF